MKNYLKKDAWRIIEEGFVPEYNRISESIFSIGNGKQGQRANFEEDYSGDSLQGSYMAGVYYPDKTRVGWWKNGYPEYFAKVLNAPNWIGIKIEVEGQSLDLAKGEVLDFRRELNMKEGYLQRNFRLKLAGGQIVAVEAQRLISFQRKSIGAIRYQITAENFSGKIKVTPYLDSDVMNEDANYDEKFWEAIDAEQNGRAASLVSRTKKTGFVLCTAMDYQLEHKGKTIEGSEETQKSEKYVAASNTVEVSSGDTLTLYKYVANLSSRDHEEGKLISLARQEVAEACQVGFAQLLSEQKDAWAEIWSHSDIKIEGDVAAQQGIRFNIFHLNQTYTGEDERLNIGPKGFTGEKYGGSTYWDTEAYCLPFYLATADPAVARNLLVYRYKHLDRAIENAEKLGFTNGAALYPMVTMNGEECHNEWEITFEEIHRNGAIAKAIFDYINYTGDEAYLEEYGLEVLVGIARFWAQRLNFSEAKKQYVMLGVTGPNEYDNNVNNNWYTNLMAQWSMRYAKDMCQAVAAKSPERYQEITAKIKLEEKELANWTNIAANIYFPEDAEKGIFLQQDDYLDKEQILVKDLEPKHLPLNQNWSWDRILRSCFIKQADTLQGIYFFEDDYDTETIRRNFEFYEPRTVHESSLSPCVHGILAAKLGMKEKAYEMYLRTSRLDLDDYNNDTEDGLHITSMAGTWMTIVQGFGGMRVREGKLYFSPFIPEQWERYTFKIMFRGVLLDVQVSQEQVAIQNLSDKDLDLFVFDEAQSIKANSSLNLGLSLV